MCVCVCVCVGIVCQSFVAVPVRSTFKGGKRKKEEGEKWRGGVTEFKEHYYVMYEAAALMVVTGDMDGL